MNTNLLPLRIHDAPKSQKPTFMLRFRLVTLKSITSFFVRNAVAMPADASTCRCIQGLTMVQYCYHDSAESFRAASTYL